MTVDENECTLYLLGSHAEPERVQDKMYWTALRGGYYMSVSKWLCPNDKGTYEWSVGLHGNVSAFSKSRYEESLEICTVEAHRAIAYFIHEIEDVRAHILSYVEEHQTVSRYKRPPVI